MNLFFFCFIITFIITIFVHYYSAFCRPQTVLLGGPARAEMRTRTGVLSFNYVLPLKIIKSLEGPTRLLLK